MKAFILAAGLGTRLKPFSERIPKPLFRVDGQTLLDRTIFQLIAAGAREIMINTHHLHRQIEDHVKTTSYPVPVRTRHEAEILDTGGGIRNVADFLDDRPFIVVNGDIVTDVDYKAVYAFHQSHGHPVTMVLHDYPEFNCVTVDSNGMVRGFYLENKPQDSLPDLAFTGIQVIDPSVIPLIPEEGPASSLDLYRTLIAQGPHVKAMVIENTYWADLGTPEKYLEASRLLKTPVVLKRVFGTTSKEPPLFDPLCGDGSDRTYCRVSCYDHTMILSDHGITLDQAGSEVAAFVAIGRHLYGKGLPVPEIYDADLFSGQVFLEDLGDMHLETIAQTGPADKMIRLYQSALDILARMSVEGARGFDTAWTCQSTHYDHDLIVERECRYFLSAFVNGVLGNQMPVDALDEEFSKLAKRALSKASTGFMHRDFQSRNIMVKDGRCYVIDFQGARIGPVEYDLASLLIDPYAGIDKDMQEQFLLYFLDRYSRYTQVDRQDFMDTYGYVRITRNLQMLGAFGFLSRVKGKTAFEIHIPPAVKRLKRHVEILDDKVFKELKKIIEKM